MALTAAETAKKELDKADADVLRKKKLLDTCIEREEQAIQATKNAAAEFNAAVSYAAWLASHPALQGLEPLTAPTEAHQTTVEEQVEAAQTQITQRDATFDDSVPSEKTALEDLFAL